MSTIRCIYHPENGVPREPNWPATDQHPDAKRYLVGLYFVDAIDGEPTPQEIDAVLNPPATRPELTDGKLAELLISKGYITSLEAAAAAIDK